MREFSLIDFNGLEDLTERETQLLFANSLFIDEGIVFYEGRDKFELDNSDVSSVVMDIGLKASLKVNYRESHHLMRGLIESYEGLCAQISNDPSISEFKYDTEVAVVLPKFGDFIKLCTFNCQNCFGDVKTVLADDLVLDEYLSVDVDACLPYSVCTLERDRLERKLLGGSLIDLLKEKAKVVEVDMVSFKDNVDKKLRKMFPNSIIVKDCVPVYDSLDSFKEDGLSLLDDEISRELVLTPFYYDASLKFSSNKDSNDYFILPPDFNKNIDILYTTGILSAVSSAKQFDLNSSIAVLVKPKTWCEDNSGISWEYSDNSGLNIGPFDSTLDLPLRTYLYRLNLIYQVIPFKRRVV